MFADAPDGWSLLAVDGGAAGHFVNSRLDVWSNLEIRHNGSAPLRLQGDFIGQARPNGGSTAGGIVQFTGAGQTIFSGNATYQRDTRIEGGASVEITGKLYQENTVQPGTALRISGGSKLRLNNLNDSTTAGASLGYLPNSAGSIVINNGTLTVMQPSESTRAITIQAGGATIEANAPFEWKDAGAADIVALDGATITLAGSADAVLNKQLGGLVGLTKQGPGRWEMRKSNAYQGPTMVAEGTLEVTGATGAGAATVASGATLSGDGLIAGSLLVNGVLAPGTSSAVGTLDVAAVTFGVGSQLQLELHDLLAFDSLLSSGAMNITSGAGLVVNFSESSTYVPTAGDQFIIATATGGITGVFEQMALPTIDGFAWNLIAAPTILTLELVTATSADFNGDGVVDGTDFLSWERGAGTPEPTCADGDANGDGLVDGADLAIWSEQFGVAPANDFATNVPEPHCLGLITAILVIARRRGRAVANRYNVRS